MLHKLELRVSRKAPILTTTTLKCYHMQLFQVLPLPFWDYQLVTGLLLFLCIPIKDLARILHIEASESQVKITQLVGPMIFRDRRKWTEIAETTVWNGIEQMTWIWHCLMNFFPSSWPKPASTFKKLENFEEFQGWCHFSWLFASWKFIG